MTLKRYDQDPQLQELYSRKLLEPGWAGLLTLEEAEYIAEHLATDARLRRAWGFSGRETFPLSQIAAKAFPENPRQARSHMAAQQSTAGQYLRVAPGAEHSKSIGRRKIRRVKTMLGPGEVYCLRCKAGRALVDRVVVGSTKKGAQVVQGRCATCGMKLVTFAAGRPGRGVGRGASVVQVGEASTPEVGESDVQGRDAGVSTAQQPAQLALFG
jgi:hypothetical protein